MLNLTLDGTTNGLPNKNSEQDVQKQHLTVGVYPYARKSEIEIQFHQLPLFFLSQRLAS